MHPALTRHNFSDQLNRYTTSQLEEMVERYPFFHQAHLLLAKKYQLEKNPRFDAQMQLAAMYAQDRELFFELFKEDASPVFEQTAQSTTATLPPLAKEITLVTDVDSEPVLEPLPVKELEQDVVLEPVSEPVIEPVVAELQTTLETDVYEQSIPEQEVTEEPVITTTPVSEESVEELPEPEPLNLEVPHTFTEWLHLFSGKQFLQPQPVDEQTAKQLKDELDTLINVSARADYLHQLVEEETHYAKGLDVFIEEQKRKHKPVKDVKQDVSQSESSGILVTETLANVYVQQKKYAKAIEAFEALSLKFPEKSGLFAARIQYINELIK